MQENKKEEKKENKNKEYSYCFRRMTRELHKRLRIVASVEDKSIQEVMQDALEEYCSKHLSLIKEIKDDRNIR